MPKNNKSAPIVLIVDPSLVTPATEAVNSVSKILGQFRNMPEFAFSHFEYICPHLCSQSLAAFMVNKNVGAVIGLGSHAHVTEGRPFVDQLSTDLQTHVFNKQIPFFGICFSHQLLGHTFGFNINYLLDAKIKKHHDYRQFKIDHPKFALLATDFKTGDYFSHNDKDLQFREVVLMTQSWDEQRWDKLFKTAPQELTKQEEHVKEHVLKSTLKNIIAHARHEQEVVNGAAGKELIKAASSVACDYEAFVHPTKQIYSVQTHPETHHEAEQGYLLIKNFLYLSSILFVS